MSRSTNIVCNAGGDTTDVELGDLNPKEESLQDSNIVDWDGASDPANPLNWPLWKKCVTISTVSFITFLSNILYHTCNIIFFVFNIANAEAKNMASLIVFRLIAGIAASCPVTIGAGSIADMIPHERRGLAMATWVIGPLLGPAIGPIAGGYLSQGKGWRWNFWVLSILSGAITLIAFVTLHESHPYTLLQRKTKALRKKTGNPNLRSALDSDKSPRHVFALAILRPLRMLCLSPMVLLLSLYAALIYGYLYLCFTTFPRVFEIQYGFSESSSGLVYLGIGVGSLIGLFVCGGTSDRLVKVLAARRNGGVPKPEYRLPVLILGALLAPAGLFCYAWTAEKKEHWMLPIVGTGFLGGGMVIAVMAISTYLVDTYTTFAASAMAASTVLRSLLGALLPLAGDSMYDALGVGWGTSLLGFISVAFIPLPFIFLKYGQKFRESKKFQLKL
ncbi:Mfs multidrug [Pleurostoma richardsiae]|uniref:Mfs multidrug n=1 Tax=Pleurostoma richardsiae TaxID=41990 RepID=A0AA38VX69_9PEZI|nr:Mfs multidrug [Pleurostoma richardsiae]